MDIQYVLLQLLGYELELKDVNLPYQELLAAVTNEINRQRGVKVCN